MNRTGQLFSLDFLLAMGVVILLLGTVIALGQRQAFESHEQQARSELTSAGRHAAVLLVSNPSVTCGLYANGTGRALETKINNCLDWFKIQSLNAQENLAKEIGLSENHDFFIQTAGQSNINSPPSSDTPAVFAMDINVLVQNGDVNKNQLYACLGQKPCALNAQVVSLLVWRS